MKNVLLLFVVIFGLFFVGDVFAVGDYNDGDGSAEHPFEIATAVQMDEIGQHQEDWDKHFILTADIDLSDYTGEEFHIIGNSDSEMFDGVFDGDGHTISNFTYTTTSGSIGLFRWIGLSNDPDHGPVVKNLGLINPDIDAGSYVGALAGHTYGMLVNCYVEGGIVRGTNVVGGLVGRGIFGAPAKCYVRCDVLGNDTVGGLIGENMWEPIVQCYSLRDPLVRNRVIGNDAVGGLIGYNGAGVSNCYSEVRVLGNDGVGGLIGVGGGAINCYSRGEVYGNANVGAFIGISFGTNYTKCFWDTSTNPSSLTGVGSEVDPVGVIGKSSSEMRQRATYVGAGWDFVGESGNGVDDIWSVHDGQDYPRLVWDLVNLAGWGKIDFADFAFLANRWLIMNCGVLNDCRGADLDFSDTVDSGDLKIFLQHWAESEE